MINIRNVYPGLEVPGYFRTPKDAVPLIESLGFEIVQLMRVGKYYENFIILLKDKDYYAFFYFGTNAITAQEKLARCINYEELNDIRMFIVGALHWWPEQEMIDWLETSAIRQTHPAFAEEAITYFEKQGIYSTAIKNHIKDMTMFHRPDDDLVEALQNNKTEIALQDILNVVAEVLGGNDEYAWYWLLQLYSGKYMLLGGECDYTGWSCQSSVYEWKAVETIEEAIACAPEEEEYSGRAIRANLVAQLAKEQAYGTYNKALEQGS